MISIQVKWGFDHNCPESFFTLCFGRQADVNSNVNRAKWGLCPLGGRGERAEIRDQRPSWRMPTNQRNRILASQLPGC